MLDNIPHPNWQEFKSPEKDIILKEQIPNEIQSQSETDSKFNSSKVDQRSKDARELLNNLSEILNNTSQCDKQRREGQHLLNSLAELLSNGSNVRSANLDDSGHSSFINESSDPEKHHYSDILESNKENCSVTNSVRKVINDSLNKKEKSKLTNLCLKRLSLSLNSAVPLKLKQQNLLKTTNTSRTSMDNIRNKTDSSSFSVKSMNSTGGGRSFTSLHQNLKLKIKKEVSQKGPMKAVIPIKEIKKIGEQLLYVIYFYNYITVLLNRIQLDITHLFI